MHTNEAVWFSQKRILTVKANRLTARKLVTINKKFFAGCFLFFV